MANMVGGQVTQDLATQRDAVDLSRALVLGRVQRGGKDLVMIRYPDGRIEYVDAARLPNAQVGSPVGGSVPATPSEELMQPPVETAMSYAPESSLRPRLNPRISTQGSTEAPAAQEAPVTGSGGDFNDYIREQAKRYGIPENLAFSVITQESGGKQSAVSPKGATGIMQLMPGTAKELGVDMNDPYQNIEGGMRYLSQQKERFGTWPLALAAYNAGPNAVEKYGGIPPFEETELYVPTILNRAGMADMVPADDQKRYRVPVVMTSDAMASGGDQTASEELAGERYYGMFGNEYASPSERTKADAKMLKESGERYYGMFGDEYVSPSERTKADAEMLKESKVANRMQAYGDSLDYLADALEYLDLSQIAKGPKMPSSVGPGVYRPQRGSGTKALQRFGIASLA
jgi:hypothetical protein